MIDATCRKFVDARDASLPKTPKCRSFKKNPDFVPFSKFNRSAKREGGKLTVLGRNCDLWLFRQIPRNSKPKSSGFPPTHAGAETRNKKERQALHVIPSMRMNARTSFSPFLANARSAAR
jgi:hypothetical protein